jgi:hypothetical protein
MKKTDEQGKHIQDLRDEIEILKTNHKGDVSHLQTKAKGLNLETNTKTEENSRLTRALEDLWNTFGFVARCSTRIHKNFKFVGAAAEEANYASDDGPGALKWVEEEVNAFDEVMKGQGNFCAPIASRGTAPIFEKA